MRIETSNFTAAGNVKAGYDHFFKRSNCQDAFALEKDGETIVGVISDGCGSGPHSEVGAKIISEFIVRKSIWMLRNNLTAVQCPPLLFQDVIRFINSTLDQYVLSPEERARMINDYWLCTVVGFIMDSKKTSIFYAGDGVYCYDDVLVTIDHNNCPRYIGYNCVLNKEQFITDPDIVPEKFETIELDTPCISKIMLATDGFFNHRLDPFNQTVLPSLVGQQWEKKGQFGLNKWMNMLSEKGYFADDCSIITAERKCLDPL